MVVWMVEKMVAWMVDMKAGRWAARMVLIVVAMWVDWMVERMVLSSVDMTVDLMEGKMVEQKVAWMAE